MSEASIDVIVPVYNGLPYILETLNSILAQTLRPTTIIVVNDGSTDRTLEEVEKLASLHPEQRFQIISKKNGGHSSATNEGIRASTSRYIALVDADDLWHPTKLEKQFNLLAHSNNPKLGIIYTDFQFIDPQNNPLPSSLGFILDKTVRGAIFPSLVRRGNLIAGSNSAVFMKREVFEEHGFFDENLRCGEDWDMWIRLAQTFEYDFVDETLTFIRKHDGNLSNQKMIHCHSNLYILEKWKKELNELGGKDLLIHYLSNMTLTNLSMMLFSKQYRYLLDSISKISHSSFPRLLICRGLIRKVSRKLIKIIFSSK